MKMKNLLNGRDNLGRIIAILCFCLGIALFFFFWFRGRSVGLSLTLCASSLLYLFLTRKKALPSAISTEVFAGVLKSSSYGLTAKVTNLLFAGLFVLSLYSSSIDLYHRPLLYFASVLCMSLVILFEILLLPCRGSNRYTLSALLKILIVAASLSWSLVFEFPDLVGVDPFYHRYLTTSIVENGHILSGLNIPFDYSHFPLMHLEIANMELLTGLPYKFAMTLSVSLFEIISLLFVFLSGRFLLRSTRWSLIATLFLAISDTHVLYGYTTIPMSLGLGFFSIIIYLLWCKKKSVTTMGFLVFFLFALILTHALTTLITFVVLVASILGESFYNYRMRKVNTRSETKETPMFILGLLFLVSFISYCIYAYPHFFIRSVLDFVQSLVQAQTPKAPPIGAFFVGVEYELSQFGMYILYGLAGIGLLCWIDKSKNRVKYMLIVSGIALFGLSYGFQVFLTSRFIIPERWLVFIYTLLVAPAALGLSSLVAYIRRWSVKFTLVLLIVSITVLSMTTNVTVNMDSPFYAQKYVLRPAFTDSELKALKGLDQMYNGTITTDFYSGITVFLYTFNRDTQIMTFNMVENPAPFTGLLILRVSAFEYPIQLPVTSVSITSNQSMTAWGQIETENLNVILGSNSSGVAVTTIDKEFPEKVENFANRIFDNGAVYGYLSTNMP